MIFDSIRERIMEKLGKPKPIESGELSVKHAVDNPGRMHGSPERGFPFGEDVRQTAGLDIPIPGLREHVRAPEIQGSGERERPPPWDAGRHGPEGMPHGMETGMEGEGRYSAIEREIRGRMGMAEELERPFRPPLAARESDREGKSGARDEELEMVIKQLDMIRSQNEMILQRLRMIERKLGL